MFDEFPWPNLENGRATGQPQGVGSEAYLKLTPQRACPELAERTPEDARKDGHICGLSR